MPRTTSTAAAVAALLAAAALGLSPHQAQAAAADAATAAPSGPAATSSSSELRFHDIPGSGGITLKGNVFTPAGAQSGRTYPLIVLPTSWGLPQIEYIAQAKQLADSGYVVVSYTSRGFWLSGGRIEVAGPPDIADVSAVIDWALAHTPADAQHIGLGGVSCRVRHQPAGLRARPADQGRGRAQRLGRHRRLHLLRPHPAPPGRRAARRRLATSPAVPDPNSRAYSATSSAPGWTGNRR